jgi:glycosyltransferase involved in cell wall biosynthesis
VLSYGDFPNGDAGSIRLNSITSLFLQIGFDVFIISMSKTRPHEWNVHEGKTYVSIRSQKNTIIHRLFNVILYRKRAYKKIKELHQIDALMLSSSLLSSFKFFERYAKERKLLLFADRTEWYSPNEFNFGKLHPTYRENIIINEKIIDSYWRVIAISSMLESYFKSKNISTIRIPAIMDTQSFQEQFILYQSKIVIIYAGSPAKKDALRLMIAAVENLDLESKDKIDFRVFGITESKFRKLYHYYGNLGPVTFYGRVNRADVLVQLKFADFSTVIRDPNERFAQAGFPSKVAESMSAGVPMITNYTSDLKLYLTDNQNAVIVENYSAEAYTFALKKVANMKRNDIDLLKVSAKKTAVEFFDYRNYLDVLKEICGV